MSLCAHHMQPTEADHLLLLLVCDCFEICLKPLEKTQHCQNHFCITGLHPHAASGTTREDHAIQDASASWSTLQGTLLCDTGHGNDCGSAWRRAEAVPGRRPAARRWRGRRWAPSRRRWPGGPPRPARSGTARPTPACTRSPPARTAGMSAPALLCSLGRVAIPSCARQCADLQTRASPSSGWGCANGACMPAFMACNSNPVDHGHCHCHQSPLSKPWCIRGRGGTPLKISCWAKDLLRHQSDFWL